MRGVLFVVIGIIILMYGFINYYIGLRMWQTVGRILPFLNSTVYWVIFWIIALSFIVGRFSIKFVPEAISKGISLVGAYWMSSMIYFIMLLVIVDLFRLLGGWIKFLPSDVRQNIWNFPAVGIGIFTIVLVLLIYGTYNARNPVIKPYTITIPKSAGNIDKLNVAMIADIHLGTIMDKSRLTTMVNMVNELKPDVVLLPGDIIDDDVGPFARNNMSEVFKQLKPKYGVYACLGNHEYYGGQLEDIVRNLQEAGIQVLRDRYVKVENKFYIVGREDKDAARSGNAKRHSLSEVLNGVDKSLPIILLDHQPVKLEEPLNEGIDLQLSGHTHRGQMFPNQYITQKIFEVDWGYLKKENLNVIVTSGFGTWGPPIRIGNSPEIVNITINFKK